MKVKAYITKYCLSDGIKEVDGEIHESGRGDGRRYLKIQYSAFLYSEKEYFFTLDDAKKDAEYRRNKKIHQLQKQIEKLKEMTF